MTKLSKYLTKHGKPFTQSIPNGKGQLHLMYYDGYIILRSNQPGVHFATEIAITRKAWLKLLPMVLRPTRLMDRAQPSFDRYRAERRYARHLADDLAAKRTEKRERATQEGAERQRQRYARAQERAKRRSQEEKQT